MCSSSRTTPTNMASSPRVRRSERVLEGPRQLFHHERFDDVADLEVVHAIEADAALESGLHLAHVVLEPLERAETAFPHRDAVAQQTHLGGARNRPRR